MSKHSERRSRPAWRPLAVAVAGGAVLVTTGFGVWASLNATAFNTSPQVVTSGTLKLNLGNIGNGFSTNISNLAPGDVVDRYVDLTNNGTLDAQALTLGVAASANNALVTDGTGASTTKGLRVTVSTCSTSWTPTTGVCSASGTTTTALATTPLSNAVAAPLTLISGAVPVNSVSHLKIALTLPDQTETTINGTLPTNTIQGLSTNLTYTFTEQQRTATTTDS